MLPKVTIITPCFNSGKTIKACVDSIRSQNYANIEHIVVDGGSTDETVSLLNELGVVFVSEPDIGIYDAMNKGILRSTGDIVGVLNSDDALAEVDIIGFIVDTMLSSNCDLFHGRVLQVDSFGRAVARIGNSVGKDILLNEMKIAHPSMYVRRAIFEKFGLYSVGYRIAADYDFILRIWGKVSTVFADRNVVIMGTDGVSNTQIRRSLVESMAVQLVHGAGIGRALSNYVYSRVKNYAVRLIRGCAVK